MPSQGMHTLHLHYTTMTRYEETYRGVDVVFEKDNLDNTLGQVLAEAGKKQIRIAETEKYPHVTFFFNGGREEPFAGEERIMCPSLKVATYDLQPEMSANDITNAIIPRLTSNAPDFICLNFANTDMVGHTGVFSAAVAATQAVDACLTRLVPAALAAGYLCWIIADHGNSDNEINPDGSPNTQHSTNLVPSILVDPDFELGKGTVIHDGKLGDVAPTILTLMQIGIPAEMTGKVLI
jgi:2,3-bisphosphoglycerate-independent phosphoglycerate mutase